MGGVDWSKVATGGLLGGVNAATGYLKESRLREGEARRERALLELKDSMLSKREDAARTHEVGMANLGNEHLTTRENAARTHEVGMANLGNDHLTTRENAARTHATDEREATEAYNSGLLNSTITGADGTVTGITNNGTAIPLEGVSVTPPGTMSRKDIEEHRNKTIKAHTQKGSFGEETVDWFGVFDTMAGVDPDITARSIMSNPRLNPQQKRQIVSRKFPADYKDIQDGKWANEETSGTGPQAGDGAEQSLADDSAPTGNDADNDDGEERLSQSDIEQAIQQVSRMDLDVFEAGASITLPNNKIVPMHVIRDHMMADPDGNHFG